MTRPDTAINEVVERYQDKQELSIATLGSHSSLQILHGAKKEGFKTILITLREREWFYREFRDLIDKYIVVDSWRDFCSSRVVEELIEENAVLIPHGSLVEYVGLDCAEGIGIPYLGNRRLFRVESNQSEKMKYLAESGIKTPRSFTLGEEIDRLVIVKLPGAKGGKGYFLARSRLEIETRLRRLKESGFIDSYSEVIIQEYVLGTPAYIQYFYSPVFNRVEIMGADIRYESNVDGLRRLPPRYLDNEQEPSFVVVGNIPIVLRESLLPTALEYGRRFVEHGKKTMWPGPIGPFCLEGVIRDDLEFIVFEFSGRIVAGTNLYTNGSPYSYLYWDEPMSMGRRIAREIKLAFRDGRLKDILT